MHPYFNLMLYALVAIIIVLMVVKFIQRKPAMQRSLEEPVLDQNEPNSYSEDGIIAVRKRERVLPIPNSNSMPLTTQPRAPYLTTFEKKTVKPATQRTAAKTNVEILYVMAKAPKKFSGYELLQSLLNAGMRFGQMNIFHYLNEHSESSDEILFSLASATEPGTFDVHNMGAFTGEGVTLFMRKSANFNKNLDYYDLMLKTASQIAEDLDGNILDEHRELLTTDNVVAKRQELKEANNAYSY